MPNSNAKSPMKDVVLITSGDLRLSANQVCWAAQEDLERKLTQCFKDAGVSVRRAFPVDSHNGSRIHLQPAYGHGHLRQHRP